MHIPIIGNGDVTTPEICKQRFSETGVDAVMIGRGSIGAPWIFEEVKHFLNTGENISKKPFLWYLDILKEMVSMNIANAGERGGILHSRRHIAASPLFRGIPDFKKTRVAMLRADTEVELFSIMDTISDKFELQ